MKLHLDPVLHLLIFHLGVALQAKQGVEVLVLKSIVLPEQVPQEVAPCGARSGDQLLQRLRLTRLLLATLFETQLVCSSTITDTYIETPGIAEC